MDSQTNRLTHTARIDPAQQWYLHLPLEIGKNWQAFCQKFQKNFDNQQSQAEEKIHLEIITRAFEEQIQKH